MISFIRHKQSISWTFLNEAMANSAKEMPKNHADKGRFTAASSCIQTGGDLNFTFPAPNDGILVPVRLSATAF